MPLTAPLISRRRELFSPDCVIIHASMVPRMSYMESMEYGVAVPLLPRSTHTDETSAGSE